MNRKLLRSVEFKFGLTHGVIFIGLVLGGVVASFYFGYIAGQKIGFDTAQAHNLANIPRLPILGDEGSDIDGTNSDSNELASEVYAKLSDKVQPEKDGNSEASLKDISTIPKSTHEADDGDVSLPSEANNGEDLNVTNLAKDLPIKIGGLHKTLPQSADGQTIGELKAEVGVVKTNKAIDARPIEAKQPIKAAPPKEEIIAKVDQSKISLNPPVEKNPPLIKKSISHGWYAQVAAPKKAKDAEDLAQKLKLSGFAVSIENAQVRGEQYFRVLVGPEDSKDHADRLAAQLKREPTIKGEPFIKKW